VICPIVLEIKGNAVQEQHISAAEIYCFMIEKLLYIVPSHSASKMTGVNKTLIFVALEHFQQFFVIKSLFIEATKKGHSDMQYRIIY